MLLLDYIKQLFKTVKPRTYGSSLETYIVSKNPQTTYEVEYWTRQYDNQYKEWAL